ncbi:ABC transporter [Microbacterium suwonense]|uniref:ABC transporter n=1 Tax=Microbacterium suwonense TaxID=683047 RepID=A0ABN6X7A3_9MICO|nr:ABC transporter [Microbacterium suwonense]BDZ40581.1 hypothetical protein GCM10025863_31950 [Microbacterium suwonense]
MSDPEVPQNDQPSDIDDVVGSANEGLDAAAAARADVPSESTPQDVDHDAEAEAFAAAERDYPGVFSGSAAETDAEQRTAETDAEQRTAESGAPTGPAIYAEPPVDAAGEAEAAASAAPSIEPDYGVPSASDAADVTAVHATEPTPSVADEAYAAGAASSATVPLVSAAEPVAPPPAAQPIFVQAPEPPRELGNRGAAGAIGLVATIVFAILYLGATLGLAALAGDVTTENIGTAALTPLSTWAFWVPVVVFFLAFWLLGAFVNRARWGKWVVLGLLVAAATYGGHLLGQLFQAPFWSITPSASAELIDEQMLAPLAIAAFVFARELTIWFGAWVARSGARKKALNAEAQAEYERTLEAGPSALR